MATKRPIVLYSGSLLELAAGDLLPADDATAKKLVKAATTANITLSAPQTIDGVSVVAGDRVLVKNQTTASQNGIYQVNAGAWIRTTDADTPAEIAGADVPVDQGTVNTGLLFSTTFKSTDTLGTTAMLWQTVTTNEGTQTLTNKTLTSPAINGNTVVTAINFTHTNAGPVKTLVVTGSSGTGNDAVLAVGRTATDHSAFLQWEQSGAVRWQMGLAVGDTSHNLPLYYYDASNVQQLFAYFTRGGTARFYPAIEASGGVQVGSSATASQNFTMRVDGAGGFKISRGNASGPIADPVAISATNVVTLAQPLPVGSGGTGDTGTAWTSVAATFAPVSGAFADASGLVWHKRIGKTVFINASLTITNNNTGGGGVRLTLPWTANNGAVLAGREDAATGNMLQGVCTPGTKNCTIFTYNNNYPGGTGYVLRINGVYETSDA